MKSFTAPPQHEIAAGWQPGLPPVTVHHSVSAAFGMPIVNYEGVASLYRDEIGLNNSEFPVTEFAPIPVYGVEPAPLEARFRFSANTIQVDPLTMRKCENSPQDMIRLMAWGATIARAYELHPWATFLPHGRRSSRAAAEAATKLPNLIERYGDIVVFPFYRTRSEDAALVSRSAPVRRLSLVRPALG